MKETKRWLDKYPVLDDSDHPFLESAAAINEFRHGLSREAAEAQAHSDYLKGHAIEAMAHHLLGSKAALAVGNEEAAMQHGKAYEEAAKHSGYGVDKVPDEVQAIIKSKKYSKIYGHKAHKADGFFLPKDEEGNLDNKAKEPHSENGKIKQVLEGLEKLKSLLN
jgi:hypothetical protein